MIHTDFINILSFDLSYRDTGWCMIECDLKQKEYSFSFGSIKGPPVELGFEGLIKCQSHIRNLRDALEDHHDGANVCLIEMPAYTQSAKASIAIGMLWGMVSTLGFRPYFVSPKQLKIWSDSKKGQGKEKVKEKVLSRVDLGSSASNDNIVDAVGLGLLFLDMISTARHEHSR